MYSDLENGKIPFTDELMINIVEGFEITFEYFTKSNSNVSINNSPNAINHSPRGMVNDALLISAALQAKDETIAALRMVISNLEKLLEEKNKK